MCRGSISSCCVRMVVCSASSYILYIYMHVYIHASLWLYSSSNSSWNSNSSSNSNAPSCVAAPSRAAACGWSSAPPPHGAYARGASRSPLSAQIKTNIRNESYTAIPQKGRGEGELSSSVCESALINRETRTNELYYIYIYIVLISLYLTIYTYSFVNFLPCSPVRRVPSIAAQSLSWGRAGRYGSHAPDANGPPPSAWSRQNQKKGANQKERAMRETKGKRHEVWKRGGETGMLCRSKQT